MPIKENDFVEIEYTGRLKESNAIFDTTDEKLAKDSGVFDENTEYGPVIVCVGKGQVLKGIDAALVGKEAGSFKVELKPENAFGNKDGKMIQLLPANKFRKQGIQQMPGLQVNIDGILGTIKTVSGGRIMVDFNHPLAGRALNYEIKANRAVEDDAEKVKAMLKMQFGLKAESVNVEAGKASVEVKSEIRKEIQKSMIEKVKEAVKNVKEVEFSTVKVKK